jgi:hypothetical protein
MFAAGFSNKIEIADLHVSQLMMALSLTFTESTKSAQREDLPLATGG